MSGGMCLRKLTKLVLSTLVIAIALSLLLLGSAGAEAADPMTIVSGPDWVYGSENISVTYRYNVSVYGKTQDDIDSTGIVWDTKWHGEFPAYGQFTNVSVATPGAKATFFTSFAPPAAPVTVHYHGYVEIDGTFYLSHEHLVDVRTAPSVQFGGMRGVNIAGREHMTQWYVRNAAPAEIEETSVFWGPVSHWGEPVDKANYPYQSQSFSGELNSPFSVNITLPNEAGGVHMIYHARINGRDFYDPLQRSVSVIAIPEFNVTNAPTAALRGTSVDINWTLPVTAGAYANQTGIFFDTVSHAGAIDHTEYADSSDLLPGNDDRTYGVSIPIPDQVGTVYYIAAVEVFGEWFYSDEMTIAVRDGPVLALDTAPETAFEGSEVTITWTVSAAAEDVTGTAVFWDTSSHAGTLDHALYPNPSDVLAGEADGSYEVTITMPSGAGVVYFILHAEAFGMDFYAPYEHLINVRAVPTVEIIEAPTAAIADTEVAVKWTIDGLAAEETFSGYIHWDVASHSGDLTPASYAYHSDAYVGNATGSHTITITMPDGTGVVYLIALATVMGVDFVSSAERSIQLLPPPSFVNVTGPGKVTQGKRIKITFEIEGIDAGLMTNVTIEYDVEESGGGVPYSGWVQAEATGDGTYEVTFKAPNKRGTVTYRAHIEASGEDFYSDDSSLKVTEEKESPGLSAFAALGVISLVAVVGANMKGRR